MAKAVSENSLVVLNYLKENDGTQMTAQDIADALDMDVKKVNGIVTSGLIGTREPKKLYAERIPATIELEDGTVKNIKFIQITDAGRGYDHAEAVAADAAAKAQAE